MGKKKLLYIILATYVFLILIPILIIIYNPNVFRSSKYIAQNTIFQKLADTPKDYSDSPVDIIYPEKEFPSLVTIDGEDFNKFYNNINNETRYKGTFQEINDNTINILDNENNIQNYTITNKTVFICKKDKIKGPDGIELINTGDVYMDYSNKKTVSSLAYISSSLALKNKLELIQKYELNNTLIYGINEDTKELIWINLFKENCDLLNSEAFK